MSGTHSWATGQSIVYTAAGTSAIGNLTTNTRYFVILTGTGTEVKLATTLANAVAGTQIVLGAKTGTAELGSKKQFVNSWITGFFPYDNPKYAFAVIR